MPEVLFVLDCGSSSEDQIAKLKAAGIGKIAVIDHHILALDNVTRSADAHVNWRAFGGAEGYCAAGECFQVARLACMKAGTGWEWLLPLAAMATVGDVVPVSGDNRIIVRRGLDAFQAVADVSVGLHALIMKRCHGTFSQKSVAFGVVPRINAAGRMGDPRRAFEFVMAEDQIEAVRLMAVVDEANEERKSLQDAIFRKGIRMLGGQDARPPFVFLHDPEWSLGICGISCSEMVEKYGVPAMMFGTHEGRIRGSGRSVPGVNLRAILDECGGEVFERYGGHEMACGAVVRGGMFGEAKRRFGSAMSRLGLLTQQSRARTCDFDLPPGLSTRDMGDALMETFYPYCQSSNPEPVFRIPGATIKSAYKEELRSYVRLSVEIEQGGESVGLPLSAFLKEGIDDGILSLAEGDAADFYFSFPQEAGGVEWEGYDDCEYQLELVDVERIST
jgi:single-stranded-DNA-specific exonuclease